MSASDNALTTRTTAPAMFGGAVQVALIVALVLTVCGCATHNHYQAARPVSATLEIEVQGQWKTVQRTVYEYPENSKEDEGGKTDEP